MNTLTEYSFEKGKEYFYEFSNNSYKVKNDDGDWYRLCDPNEEYETFNKSFKILKD